MKVFSGSSSFSLLIRCRSCGRGVSEGFFPLRRRNVNGAKKERGEIFLRLLQKFGHCEIRYAAGAISIWPSPQCCEFPAACKRENAPNNKTHLLLLASATTRFITSNSGFLSSSSQTNCFKAKRGEGSPFSKSQDKAPSSSLSIRPCIQVEVKPGIQGLRERKKEQRQKQQHPRQHHKSHARLCSKSRAAEDV